MDWNRSRLVAALLLGGLSSLLGCGGPEPNAVPNGLHYGAMMLEVGHRFELLGRAGLAHRWELAAYQVDEIEEVFEELGAAKQPGDVRGVDLRLLERGFGEKHPGELRAALKARSPDAFARAFAGSAATCNGCHQATGHAFIEIPAEPGSGVPKLDPIP